MLSSQSTQTHVISCWGIGLTSLQITALTRSFGKKLALSIYSASAVPDIQTMEQATPLALWISLEGARALAALPAEKTRHLGLLPKILIIPDDCTLADYEEAVDSNVAEIIRSPLTEKRLKAVLYRVIETQRMQQDMLCMTREIMLERELLERKNELLSFLATFLTRTSESLDLECLLQATRDGFSLLFPVYAMHAVLWDTDDAGANSITLYVDAPEKSSAYDYWHQTLLQETADIPALRVCAPVRQTVIMPALSSAMVNTSNGHLLRLPLHIGPQQTGVLFLVTAMERTLGRDQVTTLESALRHLALSMKNAQRFRQMQDHADFDALTRVHNRRHYEKRLAEEIERFTRYDQPFSIIMLDVDHFKNINDAYGHHTGDMVLHGIARTISEALRTTDYCARYGGEEFSIILPATEAQEAFLLAERLRKKIADQPFCIDGQIMRVTVSMGISGLYIGESFKDRQALCQKADAALYAAKAGGRNSVQLSDSTPLLSRAAM